LEGTCVNRGLCEVIHFYPRKADAQQASKYCPKQDRQVVFNTIWLPQLRFSVHFLSFKANPMMNFKRGETHLSPVMEAVSKMIPPPPQDAEVFGQSDYNLSVFIYQTSIQPNFS
jgi:hypothetical protein